MHFAHRCGAAFSVLMILGSVSGCFERRPGPAEPRLDQSQQIDIYVGGFRNAASLLMIDDSGSMQEEQDNLIEEIPQLVRDLTSPPDTAGNGEPDWAAV